MKGPTKKEEVKKETTTTRNKETRDKKTKQKGFLLQSWLTNTKNEQFQTTEEAKIAACKTRKRKERQESVSSLCQDHKVIRSNSEERPHSRRHHEKEKIIRRVSSSEDLHLQIILKNKIKQATVTANSKENFCENNILILDECENEKRRSHERFAKPFTLKCKKNYQKKSKSKVVHKSRNSRPSETIETTKIEIQLQEDIKFNRHQNRSPSPSFDFSTLHQQVDDSEPLPSCSNRIVDNTLPSLSIVPNRLLSSPRNSIIATHCIYLDPDTAYNVARKTINPVEQKLEKISKQINVLKKKLKKYENEFQTKHGCKPNHLEKMSDANIRKVYTELTKLKKEYKILQETDAKFSPEPKNLDCDDLQKNLRTIVAEIELKLQAKREAANRSVVIEEMSQEQLVEEKLAVQKALLHLENIYGRPNEKGDRDIVRPLYDRYRTLKRLICKATMGSSISNDLETIHEDETIHFVIDATKSSDTSSINEKLSTLGTLTDSSDTDVSISENLHSMDHAALKQQMCLATEEKKTLKRMIKEYEMSVQQKTGKVVLNEKDKSQVEQLYKNYKTVKSKIKLLDALMAKIN